VRVSLSVEKIASEGVTPVFSHVQLVYWSWFKKKNPVVRGNLVPLKKPTRSRTLREQECVERGETELV